MDVYLLLEDGIHGSLSGSAAIHNSNEYKKEALSQHVPLLVEEAVLAVEQNAHFHAVQRP